MIDQERLIQSLGQLDAGTRALLDLSLRRAIPDEQVATVLNVDPASIPPRRARGIAQLADMMDVPGPAELAALLLAIPELPDSAWNVPEVTVPFAGRISNARRARAFRRVAVAASPLVALGAVIAAVLVSSGSSDHASTPGGANGAGAQARHAGSGAAGQAGVGAPDARHGLPPGVQLTLGHPSAASAHARAAARRHHAAGGSAGVLSANALLARERRAAPHTEPVVFHPAPVVHHQAPHHLRRHHAPAAPKPHPAPIKLPSTPSPAPAPVPAPTPAPVHNESTDNAVQLTQQVTHVVTHFVQSTPNTGKAPPMPLSSLRPPSNGGDDNEGGNDQGQGGCSYVHSEHHGYGDRGMSHYAPGQGGSGFTPPGLFKRRHGLEQH